VSLGALLGIGALRGRLGGRVRSPGFGSHMCPFDAFAPADRVPGPSDANIGLCSQVPELLPCSTHPTAAYHAVPHGVLPQLKVGASVSLAAVLCTHPLSLQVDHVAVAAFQTNNLEKTPTEPAAAKSGAVSGILTNESAPE
jgi:hypothetical protein